MLHFYENDLVSSLGEPWSGKYKSAGETEVPVVTLNQVARTHGTPCFVKIDVEGFDDGVLRGMSFRPRFLSFEFNMAFPEVAGRCLDALPEGYEFNFVPGWDTMLASDQWHTKEFIRTAMRNYLSSGVDFGDVIGREVK